MSFLELNPQKTTGVVDVLDNVIQACSLANKRSKVFIIVLLRYDLLRHKHFS